MIDETVTGNTPSSTTAPSAAVSDIYVEPPQTGRIILQAEYHSGDWMYITDQVGAFEINTPDSGINYRFLPVNVPNTPRVYMGP